MLRVGLTGGVGSGKSKVADILSALGARVSRSDEVGRALMQAGQPVMQAIVAHFGPAVLSADGSLDRTCLARIAFAEGRVEELNALVHPAVIAEQARWTAAVAEEAPEAVAVVESALIFETKHGEAASNGLPWRTRFDCIVVVTAPEALRRKRYITRVSGSAFMANEQAAADDFDLRAAAQWSDDRKAALADVVLRNDGSLEQLKARVEDLYRTLQQQAVDRCTEAM